MSGHADRTRDDESAPTRALARKDRRREQRRLAVAVFSTALAVPLLLIEVAGGADASPEARPTAYVAEAATDDAEVAGLSAEASSAESAHTPRGLGFVTADDLATPRTLGIFGRGDELRAAAAAEEAEAVEQARLLEEEQLRLREEREMAAEAARKAEQDRIARERAAEAQAAQAAAETAAREEPQPAAAGGPAAAQWQALRHCESGGNYQAVSSNGLYHGAYQFYQGTWDNIARSSGRTDLVGVAPSDASPADQDALALALYQSRGHRPWPHCGSHLR